MDSPFDSDLTDDAEAAEAFASPATGPAGFDTGSGDSFDSFDALGDADFDAANADAGELGDGFEDAGDAQADDMAVWNAFEEEVADGLDAADEDEFLGRLLGGLGRAAGVVGRGMGQAQRVAAQAGSLAQGAGRLAGRVRQAAQAATPAAQAAARLAQVLGAPGLAQGLHQAGRLGQSVGGAARHAQGLSQAFGNTAQGAHGLFGQLAQLLGQAGSAADAFDEAADLYLEDGVDEALPALVGLAARAAARGLGLRNVAQLSAAGRRALVRGVASAARELTRHAGPQAVRALPRLARSAARVAQRRAPTPAQAVQTVRQALPAAARRMAGNPRVLRQVARQTRTRPAPLARPTSLGRGLSDAPLAQPRQFRFHGPVTLTITPQMTPR